jgi:sorting nexin-4
MRQDSASHPPGIDDPLDLAGVEGGTLECTVTQPIKENEGTKDVFVSYLVTTNVCTSSSQLKTTVANRNADQLSLFC